MLLKKGRIFLFQEYTDKVSLVELVYSSSRLISTQKDQHYKIKMSQTRYDFILVLAWTFFIPQKKLATSIKICIVQVIFKKELFRRKVMITNPRLLFVIVKASRKKLSGSFELPQFVDFYTKNQIIKATL